MSCVSGRSARSAALAAVLLACAGGVARAQGWRELQLGAVALASRPAFAGLMAGLAHRDRGRTRLALSAAAGAFDTGSAGGRLEAAWNFLLDPQRGSGTALYGGGGMAVATVPGGDVRASVLLVLGLESGPASRRSRFVELGVGGGVRLALGFRTRVRRAR